MATNKQVNCACFALNIHGMAWHCTRPISSIRRTSNQLEKLTLWSCPNISDISMQAIAENCRNLIYLELH